MSEQNNFLITGGQGFLGSYLVSLLSREIPESRLIVVDKVERKYLRKSNENIKFIYGDLKDANIWKRLPQDITHVFHLAAVIPWESDEINRMEIFIDNLLPLAHLIEHSQRWPSLKQVIFSSSVSVYAQTSNLLKENSLKRPKDMYGASKLAGEQLLLCLESRNVRMVSLRYSSLYGYGQYPGTVLPIMIKRAAKKKEILVYGEGKRTQDFIHCEDAANANILAYRKKAQGVYNIGSGKPITMTELARTISHVFTNDKAKTVHIKEKSEQYPGYRIDITKAKKEIGYQPLVQIENGLRKIKKEMEDIKR